MSFDLFHFGGDTWRYLSMPVISAVVGYITNVVAIRMMFHPIEFVGLVRPYLGWQGIVPRKASKMTGIAVDTITESLITEAEMFGRIKPDEVATEIEGPVLVLVDDVIDTVMSRHHAWLWSSLPDGLRATLKWRLRAQAPEIVASVTREVQDNIHYLFDLKSMITRVLVREKRLLNHVFLKTGHDEFVFIGRSGAYFGFAFGLIQMLVWIFWQPWWLLPAFGVLVGLATNWLALKMIFNPKRGRRIGPFRIQGLFFKRQNEVAADYGDLVADHIITPEQIVAEMLDGPYGDKLRALIRREVDSAIDHAMRNTRTVVDWTLGADDYERLKTEAIDEVIAELPAMLARLTGYAERTMAIRQTLVERLQSLTPHQFEAMLRPAFEEDEWILIAVGAVLGFMVGWFQLIVVFSSVFNDHFGSLW
ncbi:DUF445 domain-containing protein [Salinisphaera sp. SPP-AMP-43]|uniref:DUF445 domain-containing protein n=1 Tax=Salinisphaera sp. SPP-AMP-43 TaxID=3121288 RepID=UPI003C6E4FD1